jgi:hypothetical protein
MAPFSFPVPIVSAIIERHRGATPEVLRTASHA